MRVRVYVLLMAAWKPETWQDSVILHFAAQMLRPHRCRATGVAAAVGLHGERLTRLRVKQSSVDLETGKKGREVARQVASFRGRGMLTRYRYARGADDD